MRRHVRQGPGDGVTVSPRRLLGMATDNDLMNLRDGDVVNITCRSGNDTINWEEAIFRFKFHVNWALSPDSGEWRYSFDARETMPAHLEFRATDIESLEFVSHPSPRGR